MRKIIFVLSFITCLYSCKSSKRPINEKNTTSKTSIKTKPNKDNSNGVLAELIIDYAKQFDGVRYKYGGTTKKGMDCSGLVNTAFNSKGIELPRRSIDIALEGEWVDLKEVQKGDLLFFATDGNNRTINHVALVTYVSEGQVEFIHATTSAGVIVSSLAERYWYFAFVQARRVL